MHAKRAALKAKIEADKAEKARLANEKKIAADAKAKEDAWGGSGSSGTGTAPKIRMGAKKGLKLGGKKLGATKKLGNR